MMFDDFLNAKKMRDVHTIILAAVSRRDLCYVSENKGFRFEQTPPKWQEYEIPPGCPDQHK